MLDVFWVLFGVVVLSGGFLASLCEYVCVCAYLGTFGVSTGEEKKNILTNEKECREGKLIWHVSLF